MVLELNEREHEILKAVLEMVDEELKDERVKTDRREWKSAIHNEEEVIRNILRKVA